MSSRFGHCHLCPKNGPTVRLYGDGVCSYHLRNRADDQSKTKVLDEAKADTDKVPLKKWFEDQIKIIPTRCENCGGKIIFTAAGKKAHVAHIVPKRHFKSVQTHPENRWFGCLECHTNYDNRGWSSAVNMPVWAVVVERFKRFADQITSASERKHLPDELAQYCKG